MDDPYRLEYLPAARRDLMEIVRYIARELKNPIAAERLAADLIEAGERIPDFPYAAPVHIPIRPMRHEYRKLLVRDHFLFYWVDEERRTVTVARVIHARTDYDKILE